MKPVRTCRTEKGNVLQREYVAFAREKIVITRDQGRSNPLVSN